MGRLEEKFQGAMFDIYRRAKAEAGYNATVFLKMLNERGALSTAKYLLNADEQSDGYTALWLKGRLDLTVEALVAENEKWHPLFDPKEIERARARLAANEFEFKFKEQNKTPG
ncbi:hypothetical protein [Breoghania sp.]|uniref:hypothetical protein n=1 Tax=Breoghania sp. TaxID=2065378 RepID=UPI0029CA8308|nr:hypothetical protein [Breoghania sp.]